MKYFRNFLLFVFIFLLTGCCYNEIIVDTSTVKNDIIIEKENDSSELRKENEKIQKRLEIEGRLQEKKERKEAFENIIFEYDYIVSEDYIPFGLFTPSVVKYIDKMPLIVWLHGSGEVGMSDELFAQRGAILVLQNWELQGFPAYILCPHLVGNGYNNSWNNQYSKENLLNLIDYFIDEYSIDENRIYIIGHSLGAQGALYMTQKDDRFAALGLLSGYPAYTEIVNTEIPTKCFVGTVSGGEDSYSVDFTLSSLSLYFGEENIKIVNGSHGDVPNLVFNLDENNDGKSDFFEWLLSN